MLRIYLLLLFLVVISHSCFFSGCEKFYLSDSEKAWFNPYHLGQELIFESNLGNSDTLVVTRVDNYLSDCNRLEISEFQYEKCFLNISPKQDSKYLYNDIEVSFTKHSESGYCSKCFYIFDLYWCGDTLADKLTEEGLFCKRGVNGNSMGDGNIESFEWTKKEGLKKYVTSEEEEFHLK